MITVSEQRFQDELDAVSREPINLAIFKLSSGDLHLSDQTIAIDGTNYEPWVVSWGTLNDNVSYNNFLGDGGALKSRQWDLSLSYNSKSSEIINEMDIEGDIDNLYVHLYQTFRLPDGTILAPELLDIFIIRNGFSLTEVNKVCKFNLDSDIMYSNPYIVEQFSDRVRPYILGNAEKIELIDMQSAPFTSFVNDVAYDELGEIGIVNGIGFLAGANYILVDNEYIEYDWITASKINITERACFNTLAAPHRSQSHIFQRGSEFEYEVSRGSLLNMDNLQFLASDGLYYPYIGDYSVDTTSDPTTVSFPERKPWSQITGIDGIPYTVQKDFYGTSVDGVGVVDSNEIFKVTGDWQLTNGLYRTIEHYTDWAYPAGFLPAMNDSSHNPMWVEYEGSVGEDTLLKVMSLWYGYEPVGDYGYRSVTLSGGALDDLAPVMPYTVSTSSEFLHTVPTGSTSDDLLTSILSMWIVDSYAQYIKFQVNIYFAVSNDDGLSFGSYFNVFTGNVNHLVSAWKPITSLAAYTYIQGIPTNFQKGQYIKVKFEIVIEQQAYSGEDPLGAAELRISSAYQPADYWNSGASFDVSYLTTEMQNDISYADVTFNRDLSHLGTFNSVQIGVSGTGVNVSIDEFGNDDVEDVGLGKWEVRFDPNDTDIQLGWGQIYHNQEDVILESLSNVTSWQELYDTVIRVKSELLQWESSDTGRFGMNFSTGLAFVINYTSVSPDGEFYEYITELSIDCDAVLVESTPPMILLDIMQNHSEIGEYVDVEQFLERHELYKSNNYYLNGMIEGDLRLHDFLKVIFKEGLCRFKYNQGKIQIYDVFHDRSWKIDKEITDDQIRLQSKKRELLTTENVSNKIQINYNKDNYKNEFDTDYKTDDETSITKRGTFEFNEDYSLIDSTATAELIGDFILEQRKVPLRKHSFDMFLAGYVHERGDIIVHPSVTHDITLTKIVNITRIFGQGKTQTINLYKIQGISKVFVDMSQFNHNDLLGIQGGNEINDEYYHVDATTYDSILAQVIAFPLLAANVDVLNIDMGVAQSDITQLQSDVGDLGGDSSRIDVLEIDMTTAQGDIIQLESDVSGLTGDSTRIDVLEIEMDDVQSDILSLESTVATDSTRIDSLETDMTTSQGDIIALESATALNTTHRTSDGIDHTFIDQDVRTTADPSFNALTLTDNLTVEGKIESAGGVYSAGIEWTARDADADLS
jgi:hypothetical protein